MVLFVGRCILRDKTSKEQPNRPECKAQTKMWQLKWICASDIGGGDQSSFFLRCLWANLFETTYTIPLRYNTQFRSILSRFICTPQSISVTRAQFQRLAARCNRIRSAYDLVISATQRSHTRRFLRVIHFNLQFKSKFYVVVIWLPLEMVCAARTMHTKTECMFFALTFLIAFISQRLTEMANLHVLSLSLRTHIKSNVQCFSCLFLLGLSFLFYFSPNSIWNCYVIVANAIVIWCLPNWVFILLILLQAKRR